MQLPSGLFAYELARGASQPSGRSLRYTVMTEIGLRRASGAAIGHPFDLEKIREAVLAELGSPELRPGDFGLLLWADSLVSGGRADELERLLSESLQREGGLAAREGMEVAWIVQGLALQERRGRVLDEALELLLATNVAPSGLLYHYGPGSRRRRFPNFATQIYGVLALAHLARTREDAAALEAARATGDRLLALQLPDGGWPWIFDAQRGTIVEPYEIYSVHQDAMAPMALHSLTQATGDLRYRGAAVYGLDWIFGRNELGVQMLDRETGMLYRSIRRRERLDRAYLYGRTAASYVRAPRIKDARKTLEVNRSDRPYHLGWVLEAWAGREDLASLDG